MTASIGPKHRAGAVPRRERRRAAESRRIAPSHLAQQGKVDPVSAAVAGVFDGRGSGSAIRRGRATCQAVVSWNGFRMPPSGTIARSETQELTVVQFNDQGERRIHREFMNVAYIEAATVAGESGCLRKPSHTWQPRRTTVPGIRGLPCRSATSRVWRTCRPASRPTASRGAS